MKKIHSSLLLFFISITLIAQNENQISFKKPFYEAVNHWVVFDVNEKTYPFGFIYIDETAGFTFRYGGNLTINENKEFQTESIQEKNSAHIQRLNSNTRPVHILSSEELKNLNLPAEPEWLKIYQTNSNSISYKVNIASHYNAVGGSQQALPILKEVYKEDKKNKKLLFEYSYAYNALQNYNESIKVLNEAIQLFPSDELLHKEKIFALVNNNELEKAEETFKIAIQEANSQKYKVENAYNIAYHFFNKRNKEKFNKWKKVVLDNTTAESIYYRNINLMEKDWLTKKHR